MKIKRGSMYVAALVLSLLTSMYLLKDNAFAYTTNSSTQAGNQVETTYVSKGIDAGVWVSNDSNYRTAKVHVPYGANTVNVQLRGSWYSLKSASYTIYETQTYNLTSLSEYVTNVSGGDFARGVNSSLVKGYYFWNPNGYKKAIFQSGKVCTTANIGKTVTVSVKLQSTLRYRFNGGNWLTGNTNPDEVKVDVSCQPAEWTILGKSYVTSADTNTSQANSTFKESDIAVLPGSYVYFKHDLRAQKDVSSSIHWVLRRGSDEYGGWSSGIRSGDVNKPSQNTLFVKLGSISNVSGYSPSYTVYRATTEDIGKNICQRVEWAPATYNNGAATSSSFRCARVRSNFNLYPKAAINGSELGILAYGSSVDASHINEVVDNAGSTTDKDRSNNDWAVYQFKVPSSSRQAFLNARSTVFNQSESGYKFALGAYSGSATACTWLKGKASYVDCLDMTSNGSQKFLNSSTKLPTTKGIDSGSFNVGDLVCQIVAVKDYNHQHTDANERRISYPACVTITKTPWVQIWGGDVRVGNAISTSSGAIGGNNAAKISTLSTTQGNLYGSWGEYGMVAPSEGTISSASAGALSGNTGASVGTNQAYLSFANTSTVPGKWAEHGSTKVPNFGATTQTLPASTSSVDVGSYTAGTTNIVHVQGSNPLSVSGTLKAGTTLILNTSRTVTVTNNITYAGQTFADAKNLSQLVIQAGNITISENVTEVNAWLIAIPTSATANGVISTCGAPVSPYYTGLRSTNCNKKLTIQGAITARQLQLRRTAGAEKENMAEPAEVINQRADIYLWAASFAAKSGLQMETASTAEVAPRF